MKSIQQRRQVLISDIQQLQREIDNLKSGYGYKEVYRGGIGYMCPEGFDSKLQWWEEISTILSGKYGHGRVVYLGGKFML